MREVSVSAQAPNGPARALAGQPEHVGTCGVAKEHPPKRLGPKAVVIKRNRLAMKKIKVHSLTGRITPKLMRQAFQAVKRNRGAAGVDKVSVQLFAANLEDNLQALMQELKSGQFRPLPLRRAYIRKTGSTKLRPLGIPVVRDRVAQEVVR